MARDATGSYQFCFFLMVLFALLVAVAAATLVLFKSHPQAQEILP